MKQKIEAAIWTKGGKKHPVRATKRKKDFKRTRMI